MVAQAIPAADLSGVRIYTDNDPPYVIADDKTGIPGGTATRKVLAILVRLKLPASTIRVVPWSRGYNEAKNRPYAMIFPIAKTRERQGFLDFTVKLLDSEVSFYRLRSRTDLSLSSLEDARKHRICVVQDDYRHEYLVGEGFMQLELASDSTLNVKKFIAGRCDLIMSTENGILSKLTSLGKDPSLVEKALPVRNLDSALYAAFNKATPPDVIEAFRHAAKGLDSM
ncbi:substrate-binding periplasmic protein [Paludibacterium paludis]|uniref:substrate-binding periplasmic protein n=1 Tax=Paludibacterium paludis TaxID=1225769 RepID=UPI001C0478FA|nr:transporter substrate-binding domain-containing protein [Paludibacterium paludis]